MLMVMTFNFQKTIHILFNSQLYTIILKFLDDFINIILVSTKEDFIIHIYECNHASSLKHAGTQGSQLKTSCLKSALQMIIIVQEGLNNSIETFIYFHNYISSVFTSVRVKIVWEEKVYTIYQGILNKSIVKIHLSGSPALVDAQANHEPAFSTRDNRGIFFKVI